MLISEVVVAFLGRVVVGQIARFGRGAGAPRGRFAQSQSIDADAETLPAGGPLPPSVHHKRTERVHVAGESGSGAESSARAVERSLSADELLAELLSFLSERQGSAPTDDIVAHFDGRLQDEVSHCTGVHI